MQKVKKKTACGKGCSGSSAAKPKYQYTQNIQDSGAAQTHDGYVSVTWPADQARMYDSANRCNQDYKH